MASAKLEFKDNRLSIIGDLNFTTVPDLYEASLAYLSTQQSTITIDLAKVRATNSAGLALLIEWLKLAKQQNLTIQFMNVPQTLVTIAKAADLQPLLFASEGV